MQVELKNSPSKQRQLDRSQKGSAGSLSWAGGLWEEGGNEQNEGGIKTCLTIEKPTILTKNKIRFLEFISVPEL